MDLSLGVGGQSSDMSCGSDRLWLAQPGMKGKKQEETQVDATQIWVGRGNETGIVLILVWAQWKDSQRIRQSFQLSPTSELTRHLLGQHFLRACGWGQAPILSISCQVILVYLDAVLQRTTSEKGESRFHPSSSSGGLEFTLGPNAYKETEVSEETLRQITALWTMKQIGRWKMSTSVARLTVYTVAKHPALPPALIIVWEVWPRGGA